MYLFWTSDYFISGKKPFFIKKKYGIFLKLGHFNLIKTILQFSRRHVVVKLDALHIYFIVLLKSLAFHRSTLWKRENYFAFFSVCMYSFLFSFAANWRVKIRKFCDFEKCILSGFSNCKFCNYWISKKKEEKKIGKAKCIFLHHPKKSAIVEFKLPF